MLSKHKLLTKLNSAYINCSKCPLSNCGRKQVVFGHGNADTRLMFIGEAPGKDEDAQGLPFVGRAGKLLTQIIEEIGLERSQVYISNVVKCRPPNNRVPMPLEINTCTKLLLLKEIEIIKPAIICTLGVTATMALLGDEIPMGKIRGTFAQFKNIPVMPTYHPAYLLRQPKAKLIVLDDMKKIIKKLEII